MCLISGQLTAERMARDLAADPLPAAVRSD
jgi:hypothetical protein